MKLKLLFVLFLTLYTQMAMAQQDDRCPFAHLNIIGKALSENLTIGGCSFKNITLEQNKNDPCKGSLQFQVSNDGDSYSQLKIDTESFNDHSTHVASSPNYMFSSKYQSDDPNKITVTEINYTDFADHTKSFELRDFSMDPEYKNDVNMVCSNIF